jgi:hypothetical protein
MILYVIGGVVLALIGGKYYLAHRAPSHSLPQGSVPFPDPSVAQAAQAAAMARAKKAAGVGGTSLTPEQVAIQKAMGGFGARKGTGSAGVSPGHAPVIVQGDPLNTQTGKTYYVTIGLSTLGRMGAGRDTIVQEAQNHGFTDVVASATMPQGWPGTQQGDWYVKGRAVRPSQFARQKGVMTIVEGYEA